MVSPKIIKEWIDKADEDFAFATEAFRGLKTPHFAQICFHYQQAAEKYLKAFIVANELEFKKIHNLLTLLNICKEKDHQFEDLKDDCAFLNGLYVEPRYPFGEFKQYSRKDTQRAQAAADKIRKFILNKLKL